MDPRCSLLVLSCDAYADLWRPFFVLLRQRWPDCPYELFLGAGALTFNDPGVTTIGSCAGRDWSRCVLDYIEQIPTPYVLLMLDDFFLRRNVVTEEIRHCLDFAERYHAKQVRLVPRPGPTGKIPGEKWIGLCAHDLRYRISTQGAIWDKNALANLLSPGESAWQFERNANARANHLTSGFYSTWKPVLPYIGLLAHHVVEKGCWLPHEKWIFSKKKINCEFEKRPCLSWSRTLLYQAAWLLHRFREMLPYRYSERIRQAFVFLVNRINRRILKTLAGKS